MEKYKNLKDKKIYESVSKVLKKYSDFWCDENSQCKFFNDFKKFNESIQEHKKLLTAIGKL